MGELFPRLGVIETDLNQAEAFCPARFFASSGPAIAESTSAGKGKEEL
jgi:hypothetical protein